MLSQITLSYLAEHPLEAAPILERQAPQQLAEFVTEVEPATAAKLLAAVMPTTAAACLQALDPQAGLAILERLPIHSSGAVLRRIDKDTRDALLSGLPQLLAGRLKRVLSFAPDSAGACAEPDALAVAEDSTVGDVIARARRAPESLRKYIYVLDDQHRLAGTVDARRCFLAPRATKISTLTEPHPISVRARASLREVAQLPAWQRFDVLPVVDRSNTFIGALRRRRLTEAHEPTSPVGPPPGLGETAAELADLYWTAAAAVLDGSRK